MTDTTRDAPARRSRLLDGLALFVSAWVVAFAIDGTLSTLDDLLTGFAHIDALMPFRNAFALGVVALFAPFVFLVLVFTPQLPKRLFALPLVYVLWTCVNPWPLTPTPGAPLTMLPLDLMQLAIAALALWRVHRRAGRFRLRAADLPVKTHLVRRVFISLAVTALALLVVLPVVGAAILAATVEKQTGGYLRATLHGVEAQETVLARDGRTVRLVGMVHIGGADFYRDLFASFPPQSLVLVEGVSDRKELLKGRFSYGRIAAALGLAEQSGIQAAWIKAGGTNNGGTGGEGGEGGEGGTRVASAAEGVPPAVSAPGHPSVLHADIDVSEFSDKTVKFLGEIGTIYESPSIWEAFRRISAMDDRYTDKDVAAIYGELIGTRNAHVLAAFDKEAPSHDEIIIPWGAEHMPGIEKALLDRGYTVQSRQALNVVRYGEMFWGE